MLKNIIIITRKFLNINRQETRNYRMDTMLVQMSLFSIAYDCEIVKITLIAVKNYRDVKDLNTEKLRLVLTSPLVKTLVCFLGL